MGHQQARRILVNMFFFCFVREVYHKFRIKQKCGKKNSRLITALHFSFILFFIPVVKHL